MCAYLAKGFQVEIYLYDYVSILQRALFMILDFVRVWYGACIKLDMTTNQ